MTVIRTPVIYAHAKAAGLTAASREARSISREWVLALARSVWPDPPRLLALVEDDDGDGVGDLDPAHPVAGFHGEEVRAVVVRSCRKRGGERVLRQFVP